MRNPLVTAVGLILLLLAACGADRPVREAKRGPALWLVEKDGRSAYIFGTIHILPEGVAWQTEKMRAAMAASDRLVLEASGLDDIAASQQIFTAMGRSPDLPPIAERVPPADRQRLRAMMASGGMQEAALSGYESWAAALLISTVTQKELKLSGSEGVEPALTSDFRAAGKRVEGLETVPEQFGLFDRLPEEVQRRFLTQTVSQSGDAPKQYGNMMKAWLNGDIKAITRDVIALIAPEKALVKPLLTDRNHAWATKVASMEGKPFIAVGTAHLAGKDNLIALLEAKGYRATRVQ